eukprot:TRINITY_DN1399_c0_g2_i2.p1 TRINITY_DN1399_c0_g2~~TRINITY_DN1399_c0_g2_i2.p1  ORF type:complete len:614 (-),score=62.23 TRINITY_DN1399_c0_g2_i2:1228-3069(-)
MILLSLIVLFQSLLKSCIAERPNFILILTDDQGHDDIGIYNKYILTPNMDEFAISSVEFDNFYVAPLCAPTRASLLTGRNFLSTGVWGVHGGLDFINLDETLISQVLQQNGYSTAHFGKWHSGKTDGYYPWDRGFQISYYAELYNFYNNRMRLNGDRIDAPGWVEDFLVDRIIEYFQSVTEPFFVYWAPLMIHTGRFQDDPVQGWIYPPQFQEGYKTVPGLTPDLISVFGAITYLDHLFGRVMQGLVQSGKLDNTVVMLMGDNGPLLKDTDHGEPPLRDIRVPSGMRLEKGSIYENGIRSFLFIQQGAKKFAPKKIGSNTDIVDIYPTILELAGIPSTTGKPVLGLSLVPLLNNGLWNFDDRILYIHEAQKTDIKFDQVLALNSFRETDKSQPILQPFSLGPKALPARNFVAVKKGVIKFTKNKLFNMDVSMVENETYRILDSQLTQDYQNLATQWWRDILQEPGSFKKPTFFIGYGGRAESIVLAYAPIERTQNRIVVAKRSVSGFKEIGDSLTCRVQVDTPGTYEVSLKYSGATNGDASFKLEIGTYDAIISSNVEKGKVASVTGALSTLGWVELEKTPPKEKWEMRLTLVGLGSPGQVFESLQEIHFSRI